MVGTDDGDALRSYLYLFDPLTGEILDNKGTKLASSEKVYDLVLDIKQMNNKEDYVEP